MMNIQCSQMLSSNLSLQTKQGNSIPKTCCKHVPIPQRHPLHLCMVGIQLDLWTDASPMLALIVCKPVLQNFVCNFEYSNWTPIARRKKIATLWQHSKDSVTPTRVKASNGKHTIEHVQETFVQIQVAVNKAFSHQTTGISAFVPFHFPQN